MRVKTKMTPRTDFQHDDEDVPRAKRSKNFDADKNASHLGLGIAAVGLGILALPLVTAKSDSSSSSHPLQVPRDVQTDKRTNTHSVLPQQQSIGDVASSSPLPFCTVTHHVCVLNKEAGCSSCSRMCHKDCSSALCSFEPCGMCLSVNVVTHFGSERCTHAASSRTSGHGCVPHSAEFACTSEVRDERCVGANSIPYFGEKPRGLYNLGSSCWINSVLQMLLGSNVFKAILSEIWSRSSLAMRQQLGQECSSSQDQDVDMDDIDYEMRLAATFAMLYDAPRSSPAHPYLLTNVLYRDAQEDADEMITHVLDPDRSRRLSKQLRGRMDEFLECPRPECGSVRPTTGEHFFSLRLPLRSPTGGLAFSVQEALDFYMPREKVELDGFCPGCSTMHQHWWKTQEISVCPPVLLVQLVRWCGHLIHEAILHSIDASQTLRLKNMTYGLRGVVCHLGPTPNSGHYICIVRHETEHGDWWLYDDAVCSLATASQVATLCDHPPYGNMQSYVLLYERNFD